MVDPGARVYSTRFLAANGPATWTYTVPAGHRAVIKHGSFMSTTSAAVSADVRVAGAYVWVVAFQAPTSSQWPCMVVAYSGETIQLALSTAAVYGALSGFLFRDLPGGQVTDGELEQLPYEPPPYTPPPDWPR